MGDRTIRYEVPYSTVKTLVPPMLVSLLPWLADSLNLAVKVGRFVYGVFVPVCIGASKGNRLMGQHVDRAMWRQTQPQAARNTVSRQGFPDGPDPATASGY